MKKAVMFGAGKIGRGFIGQKMHNSGYGVSFLDAVPALVDALNAAGSYHVYVVSNEGESVEQVSGFEALLASSAPAADRIAQCDLLCTAVGVPNLEDAARTLACGLEQRAAASGAPLNIIMAENQLGVEKIMRQLLSQFLSSKARSWADANLGIVAASIERMVPDADEDHRRRDPLGIVCESYSQLPIDADAVVGEMPALEGLAPSSPFSCQEKRKLFMHNMAHALCAYLGYLRGCRWIWQTVEHDDIRAAADRALSAVAAALHDEYGVPAAELDAYSHSLLDRFANRALGDTVARVGADPLRKLRPNDRLVGAALYVRSRGGDTRPFAGAIAAALSFDEPADPAAAALRQQLDELGPVAVMTAKLGLPPGDPLAEQVLAELN